MGRSATRVVDFLFLNIYLDLVLHFYEEPV